VQKAVPDALIQPPKPVSAPGERRPGPQAGFHRRAISGGSSAIGERGTLAQITKEVGRLPRLRGSAHSLGSPRNIRSRSLSNPGSWN
jgi:hypothetical protein